MNRVDIELHFLQHLGPMRLSAGQPKHLISFPDPHPISWDFPTY